MRDPLSIHGWQHSHTDSRPLKAALNEIMFMKQLQRFLVVFVKNVMKIRISEEDSMPWL